MTALFENIYPDRRSVSASEIQFMLRLFQQDLKTVLLEILYAPEDKIIMLLNSGKVSCIYLAKDDQIIRYPLSNLPDLFLGRDRATIRVCEISPSSLGAVRTILEQDKNLKTLSMATGDLPGTIQKWQMSAEPAFVHIRWPNAEGFVFIPGNNLSARQYAFLAEDKISDSAAAVSMFSHWSEPECIVSQYTDNDDLAIWKENNLQLGFSLLLEHNLRRYDDLAGHSLSSKLDDAINNLCRSHSWNIVIGNTTVDDVHVFDTSDDAASAYRAIFALASRQITQVIGSRFFSEAVDAGLAALSQPLRRAVKNNILAALPTHA